MIDTAKRAQAVAADLFPRDDEAARSAAMVIGRELQSVASGLTVCTGCGHDASPLPEGALACCPESDHRTASELLAELERYQKDADKAVCTYCKAEVPQTEEAMSSRPEECTSDRNPARQLKLEQKRMKVLTDALVEMREEFRLNEKRYHWALMRIRIALRDVDELKL